MRDNTQIHLSLYDTLPSPQNGKEGKKASSKSTESAPFAGTLQTQSRTGLQLHGYQQTTMASLSTSNQHPINGRLAFGTTVTPPSSSDAPHLQGQFPKDPFTNQGRRQGWVVLHILGMIYMFASLAFLCNEFFVPAMEVIIDEFDISDDVAGATIMAASRSFSKLFTAVVAVFISQKNVGIGTVVGSAVFNILFVTGLCALTSREVLQLSKWPFFRDVTFYTVDLVLLAICYLDNVIMWWESTLLVTSYILYLVFMKFNVQIKSAMKMQLLKETNSFEMVSGEEYAIRGRPELESKKNERTNNRNKKQEEPVSLKWPNTPYKQATFIFLLPIKLPLCLTIPDVRKQNFRKFFMITLLSSILWITVLSYLMVWWAHQVGETFSIPAEIMGLTVLAAGTSIPDIITSVIVARKGLGDMATASLVGNNIFNITICLPLPWLLYSLIHGLLPVAVNSDGLSCAVALLFLMLLFFIISIVSCKWKLDKVLGFIMLLFYIIFVVLSMTLHFRFPVCPV
ncbi:sodium/potassium/calcium exchanger 2-like isoform X2 [Corythoichthys intestinalis]|uniref:sodium/potassium/calcium exchanger 2-like isoform X2 n=1 Tax=Corythoichthys intestinalis TaxID=161448 RepID=UPI0025A56AAB|nr:sodium/potassium/calcium exchanger 2-like isoform X2 [Corythoichthys intestinalis]XP_057691749.1 sodium/potassium/calcium exchanger 2-like isoform X2 [Corythoichthys intestinalis]